MVSFWRIRLHLEGGDNLTEEEPVAQLTADQVGMLADETQARALGQVSLQQGAGVDVPERACGGIAQFIDSLREGLQRRGEHVVVISVARVTSDSGAAGGGLVSAVRGLATRCVPNITDGQSDNAASSRKHFLRVHPFMGIAPQITHFAILTGGEPLLKARRRRGRIGSREPAILEAEIKRQLSDRCFHDADDPG